MSPAAAVGGQRSGRPADSTDEHLGLEERRELEEVENRPS